MNTGNRAHTVFGGCCAAHDTDASRKIGKKFAPFVELPSG
jgi:hypothetical protein